MSRGRTWRTKFAEAFHGIALTLKYESSFRVQAAVAVAVVTAAALLKCDPIEWCFLLACIGAVLTAEAFNAALETLFHALDESTKQRMTGCLDRAAGAVLLVSITSVMIGGIVLGRRIWITLRA